MEKLHREPLGRCCRRWQPPRQCSQAAPMQVCKHLLVFFKAYYLVPPTIRYKRNGPKNLLLFGSFVGLFQEVQNLTMKAKRKEKRRGEKERGKGERLALPVDFYFYYGFTTACSACSTRRSPPYHCIQYLHQEASAPLRVRCYKHSLRIGFEPIIFQFNIKEGQGKGELFSFIPPSGTVRPNRAGKLRLRNEVYFNTAEIKKNRIHDL